MISNEIESGGFIKRHQRDLLDSTSTLSRTKQTVGSVEKPIEHWIAVFALSLDQSDEFRDQHGPYLTPNLTPSLNTGPVSRPLTLPSNLLLSLMNAFLPPMTWFYLREDIRIYPQRLPISRHMCIPF